MEAEVEIGLAGGAPELIVNRQWRRIREKLCQKLHLLLALETFILFPSA